MLGSLVIILLTAHKGGRFVFRRRTKEWAIDFADKLASAPEPSVYSVAFFGDVEHEVLPVTSGFRITLTYNLTIYPFPLLIVNPHFAFFEPKEALVDLVNDRSTLRRGGCLGFGLAHEYVHTGHNLVEPLLGQLKRSDRALADVCNELGLRYSLRLLYHETGKPEMNLITTKELNVQDKGMFQEIQFIDYLRGAPDGLTIGEVQGIVFIGREYSRRALAGFVASHGLVILQ